MSCASGICFIPLYLSVWKREGGREGYNSHLLTYLSVKVCEILHHTWSQMLHTKWLNKAFSAFFVASASVFVSVMMVRSRSQSSHVSQASFLKERSYVLRGWVGSDGWIRKWQNIKSATPTWCTVGQYYTLMQATAAPQRESACTRRCRNPTKSWAWSLVCKNQYHSPCLTKQNQS